MRDRHTWWIIALLFWLSVAMLACRCGGPPPPPPLPEPTEAEPEEPFEAATEELPEAATEEPPEAATEEPPEAEPASDSDVLDDLAQELRLDVVTYRGDVPCLPAPAEVPAVEVDVSAGDCHAICVWGFPLDEPIHVELYDPSGQFVAAHDETLERGLLDRSLKVINVWLGGQPMGNWLVTVDSGSVSASTPFHVPEPENPTLSVALEEAGPFTSEENGCGRTTCAPGDQIALLGAGFPPARNLPLGIYKYEDAPNLVYRQQVRTDDQGRFQVRQLVQALAPEGDGSYLATVVLDPSAPDDGPLVGFGVESGISEPSEEVTLELAVCGGDFYDARLQRAVLVAVNRPNLSDYFGGVPVLFLFSTCGTATDTSGEPWDPDLARQLLAEAGYPDGLEATLVCPDRDAELAEVAQDMARDLVQVGISTDIALLSRGDVGSYASTLAAAGESVLWLLRR